METLSLWSVTGCQDEERLHLTTSYRENDAHVDNVQFDYTRFAKPISSGSSDHRIVHYARQNGMGNILLERKLSQPVRNIYREREGVVGDKNQRSLQMAMRKTVPKTTRMTKTEAHRYPHRTPQAVHYQESPAS